MSPPLRRCGPAIGAQQNEVAYRNIAGLILALDDAAKPYRPVPTTDRQ